MEIIHKDNRERGFFIAEEGGNRVGYLSYEWTGPSTFSITHTVVEEAYQGRGIAKALLDAAASYARVNGCGIVPTCSYVVRMFNRDATYDDVKA